MSILHLLAGILTKSVPVTGMAFQASATSAAETITCPTVQRYDVGVLFDFASTTEATPPTEVVPAGFSKIRSDSSFSLTSFRGTTSYKVFNGGESGSALTGQNDHLNCKILLVFRPNGVIQTVTSSTWLGFLASSNPGAQLIAASGQPGPLIRFAGAGINDNPAPNFSAGTFDATVTNSLTTSISQRVGYAVQNSAPSDDSPDMVDYGINWLTSGWLRFS